jgi:hypothetical protein
MAMQDFLELWSRRVAPKSSVKIVKTDTLKDAVLEETLALLHMRSGDTCDLESYHRKTQFSD